MRFWRFSLKINDGFFSATPMESLLRMLMIVLVLKMRIIWNVVPSQVTIAWKIAALKYFAAVKGGEETFLDAAYANVFANVVFWSFSKPFITYFQAFSAWSSSLCAFTPVSVFLKGSRLGQPWFWQPQVPPLSKLTRSQTFKMQRILLWRLWKTNNSFQRPELKTVGS